MEVLQTYALPLGYTAMIQTPESNREVPIYKNGAVPIEPVWNGRISRIYTYTESLTGNILNVKL
jgi:hypothetical protein